MNYVGTCIGGKSIVAAVLLHQGSHVRLLNLWSTVESFLKDHSIGHRKNGLQTGGLRWQVQAHCNVAASARNIWSFKICGLSWQQCVKTSLYCTMYLKIMNFHVTGTF